MEAPNFIYARNISRIAFLTFSLVFTLSNLADSSRAAPNEVRPGSVGISSIASRSLAIPEAEGNKALADYGLTVTADPVSVVAGNNLAIFVRAVVVSVQNPIVTITLGQDQIGAVKTAPGITTRLAFPEKVTDSICGDLYDPASGKGTFVVQNSGSDVFLKPIAAKGTSNLFVRTGEGSNQRIYSFDLTVVSSAQAHRVVNVFPAKPVQPPSTESKPIKAPEEPGAESMKEPLKETKPGSSEPPAMKLNAMSDVAAKTTAGVPKDVSGDVGSAEPSREAGQPKRQEPELEAPKPQPPKIIRKSSGVVAGEAIKKPQPQYPPRAKEARISGAVVVEITVDESGNVIEARAVSGHPLLRDAAVSAARGWKFNPTKVSGQPVKIVRTITFEFNL